MAKKGGAHRAKKKSSSGPRRGARSLPERRQASISAAPRRLLTDIRGYIERSKRRVASTINSELVTLYWQIGRRIRHDILQEKRAEYGRQIVWALGERLTVEYGAGFAEKNLRHMLRFAETFPSREIVYALRRQLSWTHFREIIYIEDPLQREFYAEMCRIEQWSTRTLQQKVRGMLYERTALSAKPGKLIRRELNALRQNDAVSPDLVFRDPYFLDFLGLKEAYSEKDLETALLRDMENFILELGVGFTFVARQKRITVDGQDYYLDLLLYHRRLRRLVAMELKLGKFQAADKGQMELYLRWLNKHERQPEEDPPLGLILCAEKSSEHIELLELEKSSIRVAQYFTELPPRKALERKLRCALGAAEKRFSRGPRAGGKRKRG